MATVAAGDRRDVSMIIGRRHFDDVAADEIDRAETAQDGQRLAARQAAGDRRAGARRKGRVEAIDVEGEIGLGLADPRLDALDDAADAERVDIEGADHGDAAILRRLRCGCRSGSSGPGRSGLRARPGRRSAMIDAVAAVGPGVLVRVELDQRERAMDRRHAP